MAHFAKLGVGDKVLRVAVVSNDIATTGQTGIDFLKTYRRTDNIITNPPFSIFDAFLLKSFDIADNVVFFCPLTKVFKGKKLDIKICEYGGIKEIIHMGGGNHHGFPFGFSTGCIYYQRNYTGNIKYVRAY